MFSPLGTFPILYSAYNNLRRNIFLAVFRLREGDNDARGVFGFYFDRNLFGDAESASGTGSSLKATETIRAALPGLFTELDIETVLDIPCGDFHWAKEMDWTARRYIGIDVVEPLIDQNRRRHGAPGRDFLVADIVEDPLPACDLILCRDLFIHFPNALVAEALANIKRSGARYLLTTQYRNPRSNRDIRLGSFRPVNLEAPPFNLPPPDRAIRDDDYLKLWGRTLSLWRIDQLP